eukprot:gnl/MRDRNA2_/MRDRNA2_231983_c0_seq1.p1 gnl/MRDRNA2_/MRDRNA2_231983_c0~~gnl/MRDRNA2_/MRDRNA2_231983_c0_seq1.p1  ORF type:complete len:398 (-),score=73.68 gnl/MRDRNA2_/MRDRNA2_231983_c0_seq1:124-1317(-)
MRRKRTPWDFFRGLTIAASRVENKVPGLAAWVRELSMKFGLSIEVNLYLTPPGSQAFSIHNDMQDVLAIQIAGKKDWKVWDLENLQLPENLGLKPVAFPFKHTVSYTNGTESVGINDFPKPSLETTLEPGSIIYVPRGNLHVASTAVSNDTSLHLTVGLLSMHFSYAMTLFHVANNPDVSKLIESSGWSVHEFRQKLMQRADKHEEGIEFRKPLPFSWFKATDDSSILSKLASLMKIVLQQALMPLEHVELSSLQDMREVTQRHIDKVDKNLGNEAAKKPPVAGGILELPADIVFTWDHSPVGLTVMIGPCETKEPLVIGVPLSVEPMLDVIQRSPVRQIPLHNLIIGGDPIPALVFAIELSSVALDPPIRLLDLDYAPMSDDEIRKKPCNAKDVEL